MMTAIRALLVLLALALPATAQYTTQAALSNTATGTAGSVTLNATGANFIAVSCSGNTAPGTFSLSSSPAVTWNALTRAGSSANGYVQLFYAYNIAGGTYTITATNCSYLVAQAWSGMPTTDPLDVQSGNSDATSPGSITPSQSGDVLITSFWKIDNSDDGYCDTPIATPTGFSRASYGLHLCDSDGFYYRSYNSTAAINPSFGTNVASVFAAFKTPTNVASDVAFDSPSGTQFTNSGTVVATSSTSGATLCVTTDGTTPAAATAGTCSAGTTMANGASIPITAATTIKALATKAGLENSNVTTASYTVKLGAPSVTPAAGIYNDLVSPSFTHPAGTKACIRTDGTSPAASTPGTCNAGSLSYAFPFSLSPTQSTTYRILVTKAGMVNSDVSIHSFTFTVAVPSASPGGGTYSAPVSVSLSSTTPSATFYYSFGATPADCSTFDGAVLYSAPISISANATLKVRGCRTGFNSNAQSFVYTFVAPSGSDFKRKTRMD